MDLWSLLGGRFAPLQEIQNFAIDPPVFIAIAIAVAIFTWLHGEKRIPQGALMMVVNMSLLLVTILLGLCAFYVWPCPAYKFVKVLWLTVVMFAFVGIMRADGGIVLHNDIIPMGGRTFAPTPAPPPPVVATPTPGSP